MTFAGQRWVVGVDEQMFAAYEDWEVRARAITRAVRDAEEAVYREALIALGWAPPEEVANLKHQIAILTGRRFSFTE